MDILWFRQFRCKQNSFGCQSIKQLWLCRGKSLISVCVLWFHEMQIGYDGHERRNLISFPLFFFFFGFSGPHKHMNASLPFSVCTCVSAEDALMFKTVSSGKIIRAQRHAAGTITNHKLLCLKESNAPSSSS